MTTEKILEIVRREMVAYAHGWRLSWDDFDGRTLRDQLELLDRWASDALVDQAAPDFRGGTEFENSRGLD
ncbi:MAG: hypothetical protein ACREIS_05650 [Nitrospiraceae bacterium]